MESLTKQALQGADGAAALYPPPVEEMVNRIGGEGAKDPANVQKLVSETLPNLEPLDMEKINKVFPEEEFEVTDQFESCMPGHEVGMKKKRRRNFV
jgi:hypothetical protein